MASKPNVAAALRACRAALWGGSLVLASGAWALPQVDVAGPASARPSLSLVRDGHELAFPVGSDWVRLRSNDGELRLALALPAGSDAAPGRYRAWLVGHDRAWVRMDGSGQRMLPSLPPGSYRLRTAVATQHGVWSELAPVMVTVATPSVTSVPCYAGVASPACYVYR